MPPGFVRHITGISIWSKFRVRWWHLHFGKLFKNLPEEHHLQCCRRKREQWMWAWGLGPLKIIFIKGNGMLCRMGMLLTQTKETHTHGFYSFSKWWQQERNFICQQYWEIEGRLKEETIDTMSETNKWITHQASLTYGAH